MRTGRNRDFGRALIVVAFLLLGIFLAFDLARPDSFLRAQFGDQRSSRGRAQLIMDEIRRTR